MKSIYKSETGMCLAMCLKLIAQMHQMVSGSLALLFFIGLDLPLGSRAAILILPSVPPSGPSSQARGHGFDLCGADAQLWKRAVVLLPSGRRQPIPCVWISLDS